MQIEFESTGEPVTKKTLHAAEKRIGIHLPNAYARFLLEFNGGTTVRNIHDIPGKGDFVVEQFLGLSSRSGDDLLSVWESYRHRMPPEMIPIAYVDGGDLVCLCVSGPDVAKVYFWNHEHEADEGETPTRDNLIRIADGFKGFLDSLREPDAHLEIGDLLDSEEDWNDPEMLPEREETENML